MFTFVVYNVSLLVVFLFCWRRSRFAVIVFKHLSSRWHKVVINAHERDSADDHVKWNAEVVEPNIYTLNAKRMKRNKMSCDWEIVVFIIINKFFISRFLYSWNVKQQHDFSFIQWAHGRIECEIPTKLKKKTFHSMRMYAFKYAHISMCVLDCERVNRKYIGHRIAFHNKLESSEERLCMK